MTQLTCAGAPAGTYWTSCYTYDANGNVKTKTDNRHITITYNYDALNRVTSKTYAGENGNYRTPSVNYVYDTAQTWGSLTTLNPIGRLTEMYSGTTRPTASIYSYDAMGRVLSIGECTPRTCGSDSYELKYKYDLAGNVTNFDRGTERATGTFTEGMG